MSESWLLGGFASADRPFWTKLSLWNWGRVTRMIYTSEPAQRPQDVEATARTRPDKPQPTLSSRWKQHAPALAAWTDKTLVNRRDAHGHYRHLADRTADAGTAFADKSGLTLAALQRHYIGKSEGDILGLYSTAKAADGRCLSRWGVIDVDVHEKNGEVQGDADANLRAMLAWSNLAADLFDATPILEDSNGRGGLHLWMIFREPVATDIVFGLLKWMTADWKQWGLAEAPETFPKQPKLAGKDYGNWLRLPGRHHTHDHHSRIWRDGEWLEGLDAIRAIIGADLLDPLAIPPEAHARPEPARRSKPIAVRDGDPQLAQAALAYLDPDDRVKWIRYGMCLARLGDEGLAIWIEWSKQGKTYKEGECARKWARFSANGGVQLPTLFIEAEQAGWVGDWRPAPRPPAAPRPAEQPPVVPSPKIHEPEPEAEGPTFSNFTGVARAPSGVDDLDDDLNRLVGNWPRRVDDTLFWHGPDHQPVSLSSASRLFAWIDGRARVQWTKGAAFIPQERYYEHLRMTVEKYNGIEVLPHWPQMPGIYYMHQSIPAPSGKLRELVARYNPAGEEDRDLIVAMILTAFWGGAPGRRPAFLITGADDDAQRGRGLGKSTLLDTIADELLGGSIDVSPTDEIAVVKTRLLSEGGIRKRIARLDNIKTLRFSWADLEGLITASVISGRALYRGEGSRPNSLMWAITLNGASLSTDMAQRVIQIKLARPSFRPGWEEQTRAFIARHRWEILGDVKRMLELQPGPLSPKTRWADWERDVLSKLDRAEACQAIIAERQGSIDDDNEERDLVGEYFRDEIRKAGHESIERGHFFIRSRTAARWLSEATRTHYASNKATTQLKGLAIPELRDGKTGGMLGWFWKGPECPAGVPAKLIKDTAEPPRADSIFDRE